MFKVSLLLVVGSMAIGAVAVADGATVSPATPRSNGWIAANANAKHAWLYVNGENYNVVYVYDLDRLGMPQIGAITNGINAPFGMTVDAQGTLYVVSQRGIGSAPGWVSIYPAGGTSPTLTLSEGLVNPQGVAVDASRNVYVTNRGPSPGIAVYAAGQSTLSAYIVDPLISRPIQDFFDSAGNLFFSDPDTGVSEIPHGSQQPLSLGLEGLTHADGIALDPADGNLFVNDWLGRSVRYRNYVYAPGSQTPARQLKGSIAGYYLATGFIRHTAVLFVPAFFSNLVYVFKHDALKPLLTITAASQAGSVAFKPSGVP